MFAGSLACRADEFVCNNTLCKLLVWLCDGEDDCGDNSDEDSNMCGTFMTSGSFPLKSECIKTMILFIVCLFVCLCRLRFCLVCFSLCVCVFLFDFDLFTFLFLKHDIFITYTNIFCFHVQLFSR